MVLRSQLPEGSHLAHLAPSSSPHVALSQELWAILVDQLEYTGDAEPVEIPLAISARYPTAITGKSFRNLVVLARKAATAGPAAKPTIYIPASLRASHPVLFGRTSRTEAGLPTLVVSLTQALPLSSLVLFALDTPSYEYARDNQSEFASRLAEAGTLREGEVVRLLPGVGSASTGGRWKVAMAEPVLQGVVKVGTTKFTLVPSTEEDDHSVASEDGHPEDGGDDDAGSDSGDSAFSLDDVFLAQSVLVTPSAFASPPPTSSNSLALTNGTGVYPAFPSSASSHSLAPRQTGTTVAPIPITQVVTSESLHPRPTDDEDETPRVYLRAPDLGRVGAFSGDWVVIRSEEGEARIARAFAADGVLVENSLGVASSGTPQAYFPPLFLHNISSTSASTISSPALTISPTRLTTPTLPTAVSVTVARIASPHSVNRVYQSMFLAGLKEYFQDRKRVLKRGDLIAVGINEEVARFSEYRQDDEEVDLPASSNAPTAVVFFQITSLELPPSASTVRTPGWTSEEELSDQVAAGEFGCFVDPKITKLLQTGIERSLVPDVAGFLGLPESPTLDVNPPAFGGPTPSSRLYEYVTSLLRSGVSEYDLHLTVLLKGASGSGKKTVVRSIARKTGFHLLELDCFELLGETDVKTEGHLRARIEKAVSCSPCMLLLRNVEALARKSQALETGQGSSASTEPAMSTILRECFAVAREGWKSSGFPVIVLATTCDVDKIPTGVLGAFKEEINFEAPGEPERLAILRTLTSTDIVAPDVSLRALAIQTAALVANDLVDLVRRARSSATERVLGVASDTTTLEAVRNAGVALTSLDFNAALEKARSAYSESIGAPKIPSVTWDDVGGLVSVKADILDTIQLPLEHPELFADGLKKRSGILLYGPPGTGKTLLAKAVATSCSLNFFSVKGPELLNMYIGESEANVRRVFQRARDAKPCVIFFDELDSVAPKRGNQGDSGGVMDRIVSQLLAELDGMAEGKGGTDVFVIGATNRPDLLDPALLRPGRFDRMLYLGVSDTHDSQLKIIQALTRKFKLDPNTRLENVANLCPFNYTGADFYALCSDAMLKAMTRKAEEIDAKIADLNSKPPYSQGQPLTPQYYLAELATPSEIEVLVSQRDFEAALAELVPSVSQAEMLHYKQVQQQFSTPKEDKKGEEEKDEKKVEVVTSTTYAAATTNGTSKGKGKGKGKAKAVDQDFGDEREEPFTNGHAAVNGLVHGQEED